MTKILHFTCRGRISGDMNQTPYNQTVKLYGSFRMVKENDASQSYKETPGIGVDGLGWA